MGTALGQEFINTLTPFTAAGQPAYIRDNCQRVIDRVKNIRNDDEFAKILSEPAVSNFFHNKDPKVGNYFNQLVIDEWYKTSGASMSIDTSTLKRKAQNTVQEFMDAPVDAAKKHGGNILSFFTQHIFGTAGLALAGVSVTQMDEHPIWGVIGCVAGLFMLSTEFEGQGQSQSSTINSSPATSVPAASTSPARSGTAPAPARTGP